MFGPGQPRPGANSSAPHGSGLSACGLLIEAVPLLPTVVDVGRECAKLVPVCDADALAKITSPNVVHLDSISITGPIRDDEMAYPRMRANTMLLRLLRTIGEMRCPPRPVWLLRAAG